MNCPDLTMLSDFDIGVQHIFEKKNETGTMFFLYCLNNVHDNYALKLGVNKMPQSH